MTGGTNSDVTGTNHSTYLAAIEPYTFNCIGVVAEDSTTNKLYTAFTRKLGQSIR